MTTTLEKTETTSKFTNPVITNPSITHEQIIQRLALGETMISIAAKYNISRQRVGQLKKEHEDDVDIAKAILKDKYSTTYIKRAVIENEKALVIAEQDGLPSESEEVYLARQDKKGDKVMTSIGIYPSNTIYNHFGDDNSQHLTVTPAVQEWLDYKSKQRLDPEGKEIIEADV